MFKSKWKCSAVFKKWISRFLDLVELRKPLLLCLLNFSGTKPNPKTILLEMPNLLGITSGVNENLNIMKLKY